MCCVRMSERERGYMFVNEFVHCMLEPVFPSANDRSQLLMTEALINAKTDEAT